MAAEKPGTELLNDLADRISQAIGHHLDAEHAAQIGESIACAMAEHWGGQLIYFPKGKFLFLSKRDRQIYAEFTGHNHKELARRHNVSEQHIYRIVKAMLRQDLDDRHGDLFTDPDPA
jgi:Mor family transcriptional regulator